jgi:hypothetical protein
VKVAMAVVVEHMVLMYEVAHTLERPILHTMPVRVSRLPVGICYTIVYPC